MTKKLDPVTASMALGIGSYVAIILDCLARNEFGLSSRQICKSAVLAAFLIALALGAASFRKKAAKTTNPKPKA